ncbi:unnamed protein product [Polarella glacialis]|uniref:Uncharacterized protein n=1 Tax=Polarella glacialis TaxID=89957 RepID=A0A813GIR7_POLGL|nr:unnamed protein product [Polarella glacialis]
MLTRTSSKSSVQQYGLPQDMVFVEWKSQCAGLACDFMEAYLGVEYATPTVVQCVSFKNCESAAPAASSSPTPIATTSTTPAPGSTTPAASTGRRLAPTTCDVVALERSENGAVWNFVASWNSPQSGGTLSLNTANYRPIPDAPDYLGPEPPSRACLQCGRAGVGIDATQTIQFSFSERIYPGEGT